jgi:predicted thioredoxin/glutaredoxin
MGKWAHLASKHARVRGDYVAVLQVFVESGCRACHRSLELTDQARARFPTLHVEVVNLSDPAAERPEAVFAVPTYLLDGRVLSLGNPHPAALMHALAAHLAARESETRQSEVARFLPAPTTHGPSLSSGVGVSGPLDGAES